MRKASVCESLFLSVWRDSCLVLSIFPLITLTVRVCVCECACVSCLCVVLE